MENNEKEHQMENAKDILEEEIKGGLDTDSDEQYEQMEKDHEELKAKELQESILIFLIDRLEAYEKQNLIPTLELLIEDMGGKKCAVDGKYGADTKGYNGEMYHEACLEKISEKE